MSVDEHRAAMEAYELAIGAVYGGGREAMVAAASNELFEPAEDEAQLQALDEASEKAGNTAQALLGHEDERVREVAEAQLAALAARDFAIAHDLASRDPEEGRTVAATDDARTVLPDVERSLAYVFGANPLEGLPVAGGKWYGAPSVAAADDARAALAEALKKAIDSVQSDTKDVITDATSDLVTMGAGELLGHALSNAFQHLPNHVKFWFRWAVNLFRRGVEKLKKLFGTRFDDAVKTIKGWFDKHALDVVLDWAYGTKDLNAELAKLVADASDDKDFAGVGKNVDGVVGKFGTQKDVLSWIFKTLNFVQPFISKVVPQSAPVIGGAFGLGIAYVIYSGGDYVDWHRTKDEGFFDFVKGVRRTAEEGLATTA